MAGVSMVDADEMDEPRCRVCGCTEERPCPGGCYWVADDLCSRCAAEIDDRRLACTVLVVALGEGVLLLGALLAGELGRPAFWAGALAGVLLGFVLVAIVERDEA